MRGTEPSIRKHDQNSSCISREARIEILSIRIDANKDPEHILPTPLTSVWRSICNKSRLGKLQHRAVQRPIDASSCPKHLPAKRQQSSYIALVQKNKAKVICVYVFTVFPDAVQWPPSFKIKTKTQNRKLGLNQRSLATKDLAGPSLRETRRKSRDILTTQGPCSCKWKARCI